MPPIQFNSGRPTYSAAFSAASPATTISTAAPVLEGSSLAVDLREICPSLNGWAGGLGAYVDGARSGWEHAGLPAEAGAQALYNTHLESMRGIGRGLILLDAGTRVCQVTMADDPYKAAVEQSAGFAGSLTGGLMLGKLSAAAGGALCTAGVVTAPVAPLCAAAAGIAGGLTGGYLGDEGAKRLVNEYWPEIDGALDRAGDALYYGAEQAWDWAGDAASQVGDFANSTYDLYFADIFS